MEGATVVHRGKGPFDIVMLFAGDKAELEKLAPPALASAKPDAMLWLSFPKGKHQKDVTGAAAVAKHLSFKLAAPSKLVGLPRQSVQLLDWGGSPAALVAYGQNLGGIAVIEQTASSGQGSAPSSSSGDHHGLSLPTISINGATGSELNTAIGTVVRFTRGNVSYTVLGSVPAAAAEAAARAL